MSSDSEFQPAIYFCVCNEAKKYQLNFPHSPKYNVFNAFALALSFGVWSGQFHDGYVTFYLDLANCKIGKVLYFRNVIYTFCTHFAPHSMIIYLLHNLLHPLLPAGLRWFGLCQCRIVVYSVAIPLKNKVIKSRYDE